MTDHPHVSVNVTPAPEPAFQITLREVYDEVRKTSTFLAEHVGPLSEDVHELKNDVKALKEAQASYVTKASARYWLSAFCALVVAATGVIALVVQR